MQSFNKGFKPKSKRVEGKIRGPGTGTSDDIKAQVPEGSYIMPADSTRAIGEQNLAGMGAPVDINASNGEFALPPEQVHAVGVQALNQMRDQTHTPTGKPQVQGSAERPDLFFADGGLVEDPRRISQSRALVPVQQPTQQAAAPQSTAQPQVQRLGAPEPQLRLPPPEASPQPQGRPDFYTNSRGETARGFAPSSSRAVEPAGPVTTDPSRRLPPPGPEGIDQATRDRIQRRVKADTANYLKEEAAQSAGQNAGQSAGQSAGQNAGREAARPRRGRGFARAGGALAAALPEAMDVYDVATDKDSTGLDVATQAAEGISRTAATGLGAAGGAKVGAGIGALGGPLAPFTVPVGTLIGGLVGGGIGYWGSGKAIEAGRNAVGVDAQSPIDRVHAAQPQPQAAPQQAVAQSAPQQAVAQSAPQQEVAQQQVASQQEVAQPPAQHLANDIIQVGNSFSASGPIRAGYTINGQPQGGTNIIPGATGFNPNAQSAQNNQAKAALFDRTPELGQGAAAQAAIAGAGRGFNPGGPRVTVVPDIGRMESERRRAFAAASTPHAGAQNRQLTAAQINAMRGLISDERTADNQRYATDASLTREGMSQAGADRRAASRDAIDMRRVTGEEESRGFQNRAAARVERLYEQYEQASTPEEKSAIAEQLRVLSGDSQAPRFAVAAGGQIIDPTTQQLITQPAQIFNTQTGEFVQQQGAPGMQAPPRPGEVRGGYRFKGGNPADQKNWEKI